MNTEIQSQDFDGGVRLIGMTQPMIPEIPDAASLLSYCARVSSTANQTNFETGPKLIRFLVKRREWSPLEMISLTFEINSTRDIIRQILRHRSFSFQEFSQRYAVVTNFVKRAFRLQDAKDRQNSIDPGDDLAYTVPRLWWSNAQDRVWAFVNDVYTEALQSGVAKECARAVLPEGMASSQLYMQGTLRSWVHYCQLRCDKKTQLEHRLIAEWVRSILVIQFPDLQEVLLPVPLRDRFRAILDRYFGTEGKLVARKDVDALAVELEKEAA